MVIYIFMAKTIRRIWKSHGRSPYKALVDQQSNKLLADYHYDWTIHDYPLVFAEVIMGKDTLVYGFRHGVNTDL